MIAAPVLRAPSERIFGMEVVGRHHDPFTTMAQFGSPIAIGAHLQPLTDIPAALIARVSGPVAAYNWIVLLTFPLSAAAAYLLARHLALSRPAATMAAVAFAFSPFHLAHAAYHPHVAQTQWLPLYLLALWRLLDRSTPGAVALLACAVAGVTLSSFYGGLVAAAITPAAALAYWGFQSRRQPGGNRRLAVATGTLAVLAGAGILYAWFAAHAVVTNRAVFAFPRADLSLYSAKWWSYLTPPLEHPLLGSAARHVWNSAGVIEARLEQQVSLGWGFVVLATVAVCSWLFRDRRAPPLALVPVLVTIAGVALVCSLSPERRIGPFTVMRPSAFMYVAVPMFRCYARFGVIVQLMTVLLAGIGAQRLWGAATTRARVACVVLLALAGGEYAVWPPALSRDVLPTSAHRWIVRQPDHMRVLDCSLLTRESSSVQWLTAGRVSLRAEGLDECTAPDVSSRLAADGYTHALVRHGTPEARWIGGHGAPTGMQSTVRLGDGEVFAIAPEPAVVFTNRMMGFYAREYDRARTWRWMGGEGSWDVVNNSGRTVTATLEIEMEAFGGARRLNLLLDRHEVQRLDVAVARRASRIGPLVLTPGHHALAFLPLEKPAVPADLTASSDRRPLSCSVGAWQWVVEGAQP